MRKLVFLVISGMFLSACGQQIGYGLSVSDINTAVLSCPAESRETANVINVSEHLVEKAAQRKRVLTVDCSDKLRIMVLIG